MLKTPHRIASLVVLAVLAGFAATVPAHGEVVYSTGFDGDDPLADFLIHGAPDAPVVSEAVGNASPSLRLHDTNTGATPPIARINFDAFDDFDTSVQGQQTIRFGFDLNVQSMSNAAAASAANPRVIIRATSADWLTIGFGHRGGYNGYPGAGTRNLLYVTNSRGTVIPTATDDSTAIAIGYPAGDSDGTFADGFDFGAYDTDTAENNGTNGWIRFVLTYTDGDSTVAGLVTNLVTGDTTGFTFDVAPGSFSSVSSNYLSIDSGSAGLADFYADNIEVSVIPEPGSLSLMLAAASTLMRRRRG